MVYFGMGYLPDLNAVACREQALRSIIAESGYTPVLIGVSNNIPFGTFEKSEYKGATCYSIKYARTPIEKLKDVYTIKKTLVRIFDDIGVEKIKCFIMQDYQFGAMKRIKRYCRRNGIAYVADIMDWFTPTRDSSMVKNIAKTVDTYFRMHWFYPALENKIYISHKFAHHFCYGQNKNTMVLPCTCTDVAEPSDYTVEKNGNITVTFAGFLGLKCEKEKLDWIIRALYENGSTIRLNVIGISKEDFISRVPELSACITDHICFFGYLPRTECVDVLRKSDFSIIARKSNQLTEYGFSSKICEAFSHAIPVIATNNSDNGVYIKDGVNGYICDANYQSLKQVLKRVEESDRDLMVAMHEHIISDNPLSTKRYVESFVGFMESLIV